MHNIDLDGQNNSLIDSDLYGKKKKKKKKKKNNKDNDNSFQSDETQ